MGRNRLSAEDKAIRVQKYIPGHIVKQLGGKVEIDRIFEQAIKDRLTK